MKKEFTVLPASTTIADYAQSLPMKPSMDNAVIEESGAILGILNKDLALKIKSEDRKGSVREVVNKNYIRVRPDTKIFDIVEMLGAQKARVALVVDKLENNSAENLVGIIDTKRVVHSMEESLDLYAD
jgi:predicted transcriptional regulator